MRLLILTKTNVCKVQILYKLGLLQFESCLSHMYDLYQGVKVFISVCLLTGLFYVCHRDYAKTTEWIFTKLDERIGA